MMRLTYLGKLTFIRNAEEDDILALERDGATTILSETIAKDIAQFGSQVKVYYYIAKKQLYQRDLLEDFTIRIRGRASASFKRELYYDDGDYCGVEDEIIVGNDNLVKIFSNYMDDYLFLMVDYDT